MNTEIIDEITDYKLMNEYEHVVEDGKLIMCGDYCVDYEINKEAVIIYARFYNLKVKDLK